MSTTSSAASSMAPLDQLQRGLALAHAAFAGQENAYAVNVHQHAVTGHVGSQHPVKIHDSLQGEFGGLHPAHKDGNIPLRGDLQQLLGRGHAPAADDAGQVVAHVAPQHLFPHGGFDGFQIGHLHLADDLRPLGGEELIKAAELHSGPVQVGDVDVHFLPGGLRQRFQIQGLTKFLDGDHAGSSFAVWVRCWEGRARARLRNEPRRLPDCSGRRSGRPVWSPPGRCPWLRCCGKNSAY